MSQCGASLVRGKINVNCRLYEGHYGQHVTADDEQFDESQDWRNIERKMFETKTGIYAEQEK